MSYKLLIDGKLVDGASQLDVIEPATGKVFASCGRIDAAQLNAAVAAAKKALPAWSKLSYAQRGAYLLKLADLLEARTDEFNKLLTREQGKPLAQAAFETFGGAAILRLFAAQELKSEIVRDTPTEKIVRQRTPLGVVAAIAPWNFPLALIIGKIAPALITGNTVVAKPAATTPLTALLFGELAADVLPPGVLNIIVDGNDLGNMLTGHPDVAKVSFTGSTATGKRVMENSGSTLKRLSLELGGNDAAIVLDDANIQEVAPKVFAAATINAGQVCTAAKRVYVPEAMYEEFCLELVRLANEAVVDDGLNQGTQIGPLQNKMQYEKVLGIIEDARQKGDIMAGGGALDRDGYFIAPTIVRNLPDDARLVREEQFGPVIPVLSYNNIPEVLERANDTDYGLAGTVWTSNPERGLEIAMQMDSGTIWVNKHLEVPFDVELAGAKKSGFGTDMGIEGMKQFTQVKIINIAKNVAAE